MSKHSVSNGSTPRQSPAPHAIPTASRLAVIYARVSSEEQRQNQTIEPQVEAAKRWVEFQKMVEQPIDIVDFYLDNGVSGTIALAERPAGRRLLDDAAHGKFALVLVYKIDRLGRDPRDILNATHRLDQLGVAVKSLTEEFDLSTPAGKFMFNVFAATAGFARDSQIERSIEGSSHWAKEGVWLGGIVPYGYQVLGKKKQARLAISDSHLPGLELSESDVVRLIYRLLTGEGYSCIRIAEHLNALGVPTSYVRDKRDVKSRYSAEEQKTPTAGVWRYGRIRDLVVNPVYKGQYVYGRRSKTNREVSISRVPAIIDEHTWEMAQQMLEKNRHFAMRNAKRKYLLRGLITCGVCELNYHGTQVGRRRGKQFAYYICNGKMPFHRRLRGKCTNTAVPSEALEQAVWAEIVDFIRNPGPILKKLADYLKSREDQAHTIEQEHMAQTLALSHKEKERDSILDLYRRGRIPVAALERQIEKIAEEEGVLKARLATLDTTLRGQKAIAQRLTEAQNVLQNLRAELKEDFTWEE